MKTIYFVMTHLDEYEPNVQEFNDKNLALAAYQEQFGLGNKPILVKKLNVVVYIQDDEEIN
jgi:hypothetical protein